VEQFARIFHVHSLAAFKRTVRAVDFSEFNDVMKIDYFSPYLGKLLVPQLWHCCPAHIVCRFYCVVLLFLEQIKERKELICSFIHPLGYTTCRVFTKFCMFMSASYRKFVTSVFFSEVVGNLARTIMKMGSKRGEIFIID